MMEWCEPVSAVLDGDLDVDVAGESQLRRDEVDGLDRRDLQFQLVERSLQTYIFTGTNQIPETKKVLVNRGWVAPNTAVPAFGYRGYSFKSPSVDDAQTPDAVSMTTSSSNSSSSSNSTSTVAAALAVSVSGSASVAVNETADQSSISNDLLTVTVGTDGVVKVTADGASGKKHEFVLNHRLKDVGDAGDTYNFDPIEGDESLQARFIEAKVVNRGPLVSSILLKYELGLPVGLEFSSAINLEVENGEATTVFALRKTRSAVHIPHVFVTEIELRKSVPLVFFETRWENLSKDHRLEVFIETGKPVTKVFSENHFSIVERDCPSKQVTLPVQKGTEAPLDKYPCQRFFIANDQAFFNLGLPEFGVEGTAVTLTILRAVSALSRADLRSRGGGAGPPVDTPEANCLGLNKVNYGWAPLNVEFPRSSRATGDSQTVRAYQLAEQFENLSWITFGAMTAPAKSFLNLTNESVRIVATRILESNDFIEVRLLNASSEAQITELAVSLNHCEALLTGADGRVIEVLNALGDERDDETNQDSISCAPDNDAFVPNAVYKIKLGVNALVSIRLRLKSRQPGGQSRFGG
jgi:hypothetical protein